MKKNIVQFFSMAMLALTCNSIVSCSAKEETETTEAAPQETAFAIPPLKERTGELAKSEEWEKTKAKVNELMAKIQKNPSDDQSILQIVKIYMQEARVTGEHPYYYPAILKTLDHVLSFKPESFEALTFKSSVLMSQHRFKEAYLTAIDAKNIMPGNAYIYGVLTDANVELGNYKDAIVMCDSMQKIKPSLEAYARVSYLREIHGDYAGSIEAMKLAVEAGLPGSEPYCWCRKTLGELFENTGDFKSAENEYLNILSARSDYAFAMEGLARVEKHKKNYDKAIEHLNKAIAIMPEFSFHEELAEIFMLQGKKDEAMQKYEAVLDMLKEDEASGHVVYLEIAKALIHLEKYDEALEFGMKEFAVRPKNIDVNHILGWIYYKKGDQGNALMHIRTAKSTGCEHPLLNAHAGIIEKAFGDAKTGAAYIKKAKSVNPNMSIWMEEKMI